MASQQEGDVVGLGDSCAEVSSLSGRRPVIVGHRDCQEALDLEHAPRLLPSAISRAQELFEEAPWKELVLPHRQVSSWASETQSGP